MYKSNSDFIEDILSLVSDENVCQSVRISVSSSLRSRQVQFVYVNTTDSGKQARVRILTRMILHNVNSELFQI